MIQELLEVSDNIYQIEYLNMSAITKRLPIIEKMQLIEEVEKYVDVVINMFNDMSDSYDYIARNKINYIEDKDAVNTEGYVEFAYFMQPNTISINSHIFESVFQNEEILSILTFEKCKEILVNHELFHYLEYKSSSILAEMKNNNAYSLIGKKRYKNVVSELSAMRLAKKLSKIEYSPYILNVILLLHINSKLACEKAKQVIELNNHMKG